MSANRRQWIPLSLPRRVIIELMRTCHGIPTVTAERRMELAELVLARQQIGVRPAWSVILAKAFAAVAAHTPALRTSYIPWPWPHLHLHPISVATIVVEREYGGEEGVFFTHIRHPEDRTLAELDAYLRHCKQAPVESVRSYRRALQLVRLPWPLRGLAMWLGLNASGRLREQFFGTFGLTSPASSGAGMLHLITCLTAMLHYGLFDADSRIDLRLTFDHRVLDGATAARALVELEDVLHGHILDELRQAAAPRLAA